MSADDLQELELLAIGLDQRARECRSIRCRSVITGDQVRGDRLRGKAAAYTHAAELLREVTTRIREVGNLAPKTIRPAEVRITCAGQEISGFADGDTVEVLADGEVQS